MIAIISDIHGNYEALRVVLDYIDSKNIIEIYCLGDVVGYYSQVNECCDALRQRNVKCVMGNHEWYLVSGTMCDRSQSVNDCLAYQRRVISEENLKWIHSFGTLINVHNISMVHGGWRNPIDEYFDTDDMSYFKNIDGKFFASGHTHIAKICRFCDKEYCNPGSVGQPRDGDSRASFAIFSGNGFAIHRLEYDIEKVGFLMDRAGFNPYYYGCLKDGARHLHI